ncbi:ABC transporter ATP-binding protein [Pedococcus sp. 5OH_020]|uniref:ABC transporter ATP-binding protein n=1 Tax=Pedococcus sp. 5OH_020 TaxID=2989814 RepID=UPI0022E9AC78|nr:ATP-binding cassette domain-containing protein [Pedococcus sp. 5OH_020]
MAEGESLRGSLAPVGAVGPQEWIESVDTPPLRLSGVTVRYGDTVAVDAAELEAYAGELIAVTGHSGAGKSSLLWAVAGAVPFDGTVLLGADAVTDRAQAASLGIEVIPQGSALAVLLSAHENVALPLLARAVPADLAHRRASSALRAVGLEESAAHLAEELSGGQQQRVAVARGLALHGRVLLADEPTSELDHDNRERVLALLRAEADRGAIVLMATHDPEAAEAADGEIRLDDGRVDSVRLPQG